MIITKLSILSLALAGCAAAYAIGLRTRRLEKQQHKQDLRNWEDDGGQLARSGAPALPRSAQTG